MEAAHNVLSIEDRPDTVAGVADELRDLGMEVEETERLDTAEALVSKQHYDLLLVDHVIPYAGLEAGGLEFVRRLKSGQFGPLNANTPFAIVTAYPYRDIDSVVDLDGFLAPISKTGSVVRALVSAARDRLPWFPRSVDTLIPAYIAEDVLIVEEAADADGRLRLITGAWPYGDSITIAFDELPPEVQEEVISRDFPVFLSASINLDARVADDVLPHAIELLPRISGQEDSI